MERSQTEIDNLKEMGFTDLQLVDISVKLGRRILSRFYRRPWYKEFTPEEMFIYADVENRLYKNHIDREVEAGFI